LIASSVKSEPLDEGIGFSEWGMKPTVVALSQASELLGPITAR
jgi:hypothetical protein